MKINSDFSAFFGKYEHLLLLFLALLVIVIYANTLNGPFVFDDRPNIISNPDIRLSELSLKGLAKAAFESPMPHRPLSNISFALNYYLHGYSPLGFRLLNILIHCSTGILLYFFVKTTLSTPAIRSRYVQQLWIAFFAAAVWMVHPLQTQSISYIVQRMNSMAAMFYLLSILFYARFRLAGRRKHRWWLLSGCILAAVLALASKQIAATLPFVILAYELYFFRFARPKIVWVSAAGCMLLTIVIALLFMDGAPFDRIMAGYAQRDFTVIQRLLTQPRVVMLYLSLLLWPSPSRLNLDHDFAISQSLLDPVSTILAMAALAGLILLAAVTAKKTPLVSFGILWFFANLVIESSIVPLEIIFEHRLYLPSMMFCLLMVVLVYRCFKTRWPATVLFCLVIAVGVVWTFERNAVYADRVTLWRDCTKKSPHKARPHNNLGVALADSGYHDDAIVQYQKTLKINPNYAETYANIGLSLAEQGKVEQSIPQFLKTLELNPEDARTHSNLGAVLVMLERNTEAVEHLTRAAKLDPQNASAQNNLGVALQRLNRFEEAQDHFALALRINPEYATARKNYTDNTKNLK